MTVISRALVDVASCFHSTELAMVSKAVFMEKVIAEATVDMTKERHKRIVKAAITQAGGLGAGQQAQVSSGDRTGGRGRGGFRPSDRGGRSDFRQRGDDRQRYGERYQRQDSPVRYRRERSPPPRSEEPGRCSESRSAASEARETKAGMLRVHQAPVADRRCYWLHVP